VKARLPLFVNATVFVNRRRAVSFESERRNAPGDASLPSYQPTPGFTGGMAMRRSGSTNLTIVQTL
jgi:hypothetical protein